MCDLFGSSVTGPQKNERIKSKNNQQQFHWFRRLKFTSHVPQSKLFKMPQDEYSSGSVCYRELTFWWNDGALLLGIFLSHTTVGFDTLTWQLSCRQHGLPCKKEPTMLSYWNEKETNCSFLNLPLSTSAQVISWVVMKVCRSLLDSAVVPFWFQTTTAGSCHLVFSRLQTSTSRAEM